MAQRSSERDERPARVPRDGPALFDGAWQTGTVQRVIKDKGFLFVSYEEDGRPTSREVFVHRTGSFEDPEQFDRCQEGTRLRYRVCDTSKGWRAFDAQLVD